MTRNSSKSVTSEKSARNSMSLRFGAKWRSVRSAVATATRGGLGIACVDLDSVLLHHNPEDGISRLGRPLPLGRELTKLLKQVGLQVVVLTARPGLYNHGKIHEYLTSRGFEVTRVTNRKPAADIYFDDKAFRIPKNWH